MTGYERPPAAPGGTGSPGDTVGAIATAAVTSWSRLAEAWFRNLVRLAKVPLELIEDEDPKLGVCQTSVFVETPLVVARGPGGHGAADVACVAIRHATTGVAAATTVTVTPDHVPLNGEAQEVEIAVPGGIEPGLYEVTLHLAGTNQQPQSYVVPFGIPV